jgi:hypothetical protein
MDGLKFKIYKALPAEAKQTLVSFFNKILRTSEILNKWCETKVVAILKPGKDPTLPGSFRPISLSGCDRKIMKKMLSTRFDFWAENNHVLSPTQCGFRTGRGTRDCLTILISSHLRLFVF